MKFSINTFKEGCIMNKESILLVILFISIHTLAQDKTEEVIISSGNSIITNDVSVNWIVGENFIDYDVLFDLTAVHDSINNTNQTFYTAYPTITSGILCIESKTPTEKDLFIQIYDTSKKRVSSQKWSNNPMEINLTQMPSCMYIIQLIDNDQHTVATFKVIKK